MFRDENLLINFLLKKAHKMVLCQQKNVYWIYVFSLNLRLWNQHKPDNNLLVSLTHDPIWSDSKMWVCDSKMWVCDMRVWKWQVCELQGEQFTSCISTNL